MVISIHLKALSIKKGPIVIKQNPQEYMGNHVTSGDEIHWLEIGTVKGMKHDINGQLKEIR